MKPILTAMVLMATLSLYAQETQNKIVEKWTSGRPDGHAPISVMGDHMHGKGEWMFSYRYMLMNMEDLKRGSDDATFEDALSDYMVTPTKMPMNMHMLGAMYAPSDRITVVAMVNVTTMEMDHITRMGGVFTTETSGFGDINISGMYKILDRNRQIVHARLGFSLPTGSVTEKDVIPASAPNEVNLPYPMQIASGTFDSGLGVTYLFQGPVFSYGGRISGTFRFGKNERDYAYGNQYKFTNWFGSKLTDWFSLSAKLERILTSEIRGEDSNLNPMMVITADTANSGGNILNSGIGFNLYAPSGALKNLRFGFEFGLPLYQDLNGIQLKNKETLTFGLQYSI
ncbi:MAG: transporter [Pricia sp.]|nr:transporter [Pricia sp.]